MSASLLYDTTEMHIYIGFEQCRILLIYFPKDTKLIAAGIVLDGISTPWVTFLRGALLRFDYDAAKVEWLISVAL
jgi:hypothetical protein